MTARAAGQGDRDRGDRDNADRLARLDADIADAEQRVTEQALRYEMMEFDGQDARRAMKLLETLEAIYIELIRFRQTLREGLARTASPHGSAPPASAAAPRRRPRPRPQG